MVYWYPETDHIKPCWLIDSWLGTLLERHSSILRYQGPAQATQMPSNWEECRLNSWEVPQQMLLSNVCLMLIHTRSSRVSGHITSESLGRLKSHQRDYLNWPGRQLSPSEAGKGGIVQWFPDLINAGKNLGAAQKRAIGSVEAQGWQLDGPQSLSLSLFDSCRPMSLNCFTGFQDDSGSHGPM